MPVKTTCPSADEFERLLKWGGTAEHGQFLFSHLESCPQCWETVAPLLERDTLLKGVTLGGTAVAPALVEQLMDLIPAWGTGEFGALSATPADYPEPALPLTPPAIAPYRVERLLGRGGMGAVYLATDMRLNRPVALKVMLPRFAASAAARERFLREARAAAQVADDHVVTVYEADERDGVPFIAMQFLQGESLEDHLRKKTEFSVDHILRIAEETAKGLGAAHALGLVHRDVKPGNIWIEAPSGRVKVLDFGLAKAFDAPMDLTGSGTLVGTPAFMSPEQGRGKTLDARSDLFSLGVVLYRLCVGRLPFDGSNTLAVLTALAVDNPAPVRSHNPAIPEPLAELVHHLLAKDPDRRPQSAAKVAERVRRMRAGEPVRKMPRRTPWVAAGLFAVLALVAAGIIITIKNKDGTETKIEVPEGASVTVKAPDGKSVTTVVHVADADWEKSIAHLKGEERMAAVGARLTVLNPRFNASAVNTRLENGEVVALEIRDASDLANLAPLRALSTLKDIHIHGSFRNPADISPLRGLKLTSFQANACPIKDISPLAGMPLTNAGFWGNTTADISSLRGMKLTQCNVGHSPTKDISVLKGMPLEELCMNYSQVDDLSPLIGAPLKQLFFEHTKVTDISPIAGMPVEWLTMEGVPIKDYSPLRTLRSLKRLEMDEPKKHADILRAIPKLQTINHRPVAEVLGDER